MRKSHQVLALSALAIACAGTAWASPSTDTQQVQAQVQADTQGNEVGAFADSVQAQLQRLTVERRYYPQLFKIAYQRYPRIPAGVLEALAYTQSQWHHLRPDLDGTQAGSHTHLPPTWGVMGLSAGDGFTDQTGEASALLGVSVDKVKNDPLTNILAAAALLDRGMGSTVQNVEDMAPVLQRYAPFGDDGGQVDDFARAVFAKEVLQAMDQGVNDNGVQVPERAVEWERAYSADMLLKLNASMVRLDATRDKVETEQLEVDPISEQLVDKNQARAAAAAAAVDFPGARWDPTINHSSRNGTAVREVILHTTEGSFASAVSWFKTSRGSRAVSSHYVLSPSGQVVQMVRENRNAWHAYAHNAHSIGIEHAGRSAVPGTWTPAILERSAAITRSICARYSAVNCTNAVKVNGNPATNVAESIAIKGHGMLSSNESRTDPGPYFNWVNYYRAINPGSVAPSRYTILDTFETSVGRFATSPTHSGSTKGISSASTLTRNCTQRRAGKCSLHLVVADNPATTANWEVRLLSGLGEPARNGKLQRNGVVGVWVYPYSSGASIQISIDDSDGTERSTARAVPGGKWTYVSWDLTNDANWNVWAGKSNGRIDAATVTVDAVWLLRPNIGGRANFLFDQVQLYRK